MNKTNQLSTTRLEIRNVGKRFGGVTALADVSLNVKSGEVHAICGENGAGKSTLMKILSGVITEYDGELLLHGGPVRFTGPRHAEELGVSIIHQELNLAPHLTAAANIFLGREPTRWGFLDERTMEREAELLFSRLGANISPRVKVRDLRVGDQQMVEIAKALSLEADVLIMDEPTSALAEGETQRLFQVMEQLRAQGVTILYISHKMDEVFRLADRITVLRDGRHVMTLDRDHANPNTIINLMVGRDIANLQINHDIPRASEILHVENLSLPHRLHPQRWHLRDIHFSVFAGEIVGIAGLLGAGRTELLETIFGVCPTAPQGKLHLAGTPYPPRSPSHAIAQGIAFVTEDRKTLGLFPHLNVQQNITLCTLPTFSPRQVLHAGAERQAAAQQITRLGIRASSPHAPITSLSGGNQQKCILARWLLTNPKLLLLDEPTRGIDVGAKADIYQLLRQLCANGMGVIMTSSELPELLTVCDRILVLCAGRLTGAFARADATEEAILHAATAFLKHS